MEENKLTELKEKLVEAIKSIDFAKLTLWELKAVAEISETVDKLDKKDYADMLADTMKQGLCCANAEKPKTIGELKEG